MITRHMLQAHQIYDRGAARAQGGGFQTGLYDCEFQYTTIFPVRRSAFEY